MINTLKLFDELQETMDASSARKIATIIGMMYDELKNTVTKAEFNELKSIVQELAIAQKELAEAQQRTEKRVEELTDAQQGFREVVKELAEAQKRTEIELQKLVKDYQETKRQLGGLSDSFGFSLENESYKALPKLLEKNYGIIVKEKLKRQYIKDNVGNYIEVDIVGEGSKNGDTLIIIGECKSKLSKNNVDNFIRKKLNRLNLVYDKIFPVLVTHMISSHDVEAYTQEKSIALCYSYDF